MIPNFYILGAPKCGTTAMFRYLSEHPNVFMSDPKEPSYWSSDFPGARQSRPLRLDCLDDYLRLFEGSSQNARVIGEATTHYLASGVAVSRIHQFNPASKFLVMFRNPIEFAPSYHNEEVYAMNEDVLRFEAAWELQEERAQGRHIPSNCSEPAFLQYRRMGAFGSQAKRLMEQVDPQQYRIVLLEDFVSDPRRTYLGVLDFLDLADDDRTSFPVVNRAKTHRFRMLNSLYYCKQGIRGRTIRLLRSWARRISPLRSAWRKTRSKDRSKIDITMEMRKQLAEVFEDEIQLLSTLINRDLEHWLEVEPVSR